MIKIHNVSKSFGDTSVLNNVSLCVETGSIFGLAGGSGGGKTTLLRCIQGLEKMDSGTIEFDGKACFMFQDFQLFPHMTVLQNLTYAPLLRNCGYANKKECEEHARSILKALGIETKANERPQALSGGQKQRTALARSLMVRPDVLLCDEPTSGLDAAAILDVITLLRSLDTARNCACASKSARAPKTKKSTDAQNQKMTIIIASHDLDFLTQLASRVVLMKDGAIATDIRPSEFKNPVAHLKRYY